MRPRLAPLTTFALTTVLLALPSPTSFTVTTVTSVTSLAPTSPTSADPMPAAWRMAQGSVPRGGFGWPLPGFPTVLRRFDPPDRPYGPGHRGVDLGGWAGQPVLAAGTGTVVFAGVVADKPVVSVDHPGGLRTTYEPVVATVAVGQRVARGDQLGTLQPGHPGCLAAACLHWGVRRGDQYLDPLWLLAPGRVRLLPTR